MTMRCALPTPGIALDRAVAARALVPELARGAVTLRAVLPTDYDAFCEILCSERGDFLGGEETTTTAWYGFAPLSAGWLLHGHGGWAVEVAGEVAGFVLIGLEPGDEEPELGYFMRAAFEGKGHAFEACSAALDWARTTLMLPGLVSYIDPANTRSIALAKRLNAIEDGTVSGSLVFRHPMDDDGSPEAYA
ncbi:GNAT family N-acetyltransferase [Roseobacteraceae bacterium S113]